MEYSRARSISNTILFDVIIIAIIAIIWRSSIGLAIVFGVVAIAALEFDQIVEFAHHRRSERR